MNSRLGRLGDGLLTIGAVLGVCCLLLVVVGPLMDLRPLLFRSDSMTPTIETGDLAIARTVPARDLGVGDIVSVPSGDDRVTHRIVAIGQRHDGGASLTLRGDGNQSADPEPYDVASADRVVLVVPWVGRVITAVSSPTGLFALGLAAAGLLMLAIRGGPGSRGDDAGRRRQGGRRRGGRRRASRVAAVASGAAMVVAVAGPASAAPWTDDVAVTGTTLTATTIPTTTLTCHNLSLLSLRFDWTAVAGATSYTLFYNSGANSLNTTNTTATVGSLVDGGTAWVVVRRNFGSTTWSSANSNTVSYSVLLVATCT